MSAERVRNELRHFIEQLGETGDAYRFDDMIAAYISEYGAIPVREVGVGSLVQLLLDHHITQRTGDPCPSWCEDEQGHRYMSMAPDTGRSLRDHTRRLSPHVTLTLVEYEDGDLFAEPIHLSVYVDDVGRHTAAEVRQMAAELLNAADELDKVTDSEPWTEDKL